MRQRKIKNLEERLDLLITEGAVIDQPQDHKGCWRQLFEEGLERADGHTESDGQVRSDGQAKLFVEIGCGKGRFIVETARQNPKELFLGIEIQGSAIVLAAEKHKDDKNLRFIFKKVGDAREIFENGELDGLYLNFSDPWPKKKHAKRRLTSESFLRAYADIIAEGGSIALKTDNDGLYQFTLEEVDRLGHELGFEIQAQSQDLHKSQYADQNIMTEYEKKFSDKGKNINYLLIRKRNKDR